MINFNHSHGNASQNNKEKPFLCQEMGKHYKYGKDTILAKMWETGQSHNLTWEPNLPYLQKGMWQCVWKHKVKVYFDQIISLLGIKPTEIASEFMDVCSEMFFAPLSVK